MVGSGVDCRRLIGNAAACAKEAVRGFRDRSRAVQLVITARQNCGMQWRTQRRRMPLGVDQAIRCQSVSVGMLMRSRTLAMHQCPSLGRR